jgi:hypothetical protein
VTSRCQDLLEHVEDERLIVDEEQGTREVRVRNRQML